MVEEMYFHGYLLPRISRLGAWAPLVNTVLFSLYHFFTPWLNVGRIAIDRRKARPTMADAVLTSYTTMVIRPTSPVWQPTASPIIPFKIDSGTSRPVRMQTMR